jgi:hypothetical protein
MPHHGLSEAVRKQARTTDIFPTPMSVEWGDYGAPYQKPTLWTTNYARMRVITPTHSKAQSTIAAPKTADGKLPDKVAKEPGWKAAWPRQFMLHMFDQISGRSEVTPMCHVVISAEDQRRVATLVAQTTRTAVYGAPSESNRSYIKSLREEAWIIFTGDDWEWGEARGIEWLEDEQQFEVHFTLEKAGACAHSETELKAWKKAAVSQVVRSGEIHVDFVDGQTAMKIHRRTFRTECGEACHMVTDRHGNRHDMNEGEVWATLVRTDMPDTLRYKVRHSNSEGRKHTV